MTPSPLQAAPSASDLEQTVAAIMKSQGSSGSTKEDLAAQTEEISSYLKDDGVPFFADVVSIEP